MTLFFLLTGSFRAIVKNNISIMNMNLKNLDAAYGITEKTPTNTRDIILILLNREHNFEISILF